MHLYGFSKDYPPTHEAEFLDFAKSLRSEIIYQGIAQAHPQTPAKAFVKNESVYRHYAEKGIWPRGFLVTGDAVCSFNPILGLSRLAQALKRDPLEIIAMVEAQSAKNETQREFWKTFKFSGMRNSLGVLLCGTLGFLGVGWPGGNVEASISVTSHNVYYVK